MTHESSVVELNPAGRPPSQMEPSSLILSWDFAPYPETVRVTSHLALEGRRRKVNQYLRGDRIGKGQHGEVFLCRDEVASGREVVRPLFLQYPCPLNRFVKQTFYFPRH